MSGALEPELDHKTGTPTEEEQLRAGTYSLLAGLLRSPPKEDLFTRLSAIGAQENARTQGIEAAWAQLKSAAEQTDIATVDDEYHALFIGVGRGELVPYGSWYLTGFMMEKPLGALRQDLAKLGFERQPNVHEPEDHAAALCEVMALLIIDDEISFLIQRNFFDAHISPWLETFFVDVMKAPSARFYRAVGNLGCEFIKLEKRYFSMLV